MDRNTPDFRALSGLIRFIGSIRVRGFGLMRLGLGILGLRQARVRSRARFRVLNHENTFCSLQFIIVCISFYTGGNFNDTVIITEIPEGQTQVLQKIQIFDDEINEAPELFTVVLNVLSEQRSNVMFSIQRTICRIRQSDRKLSYKYSVQIYVVHFSLQNCYFVKCLVPIVYNSCPFCV